MINGEIIESVKFRFTQQEILGKKKPVKTDKNLLDLDQILERNGVEL